MRILPIISWLALCLCARGQVAIYKYAESGTVTGDFQSYRVTFSGYIIFDLQSGELSGVQTVTGSKQYFDLDLSGLTLGQAHSKTTQIMTFHLAYTDTDTDGNPTLFFTWLKGVNATVEVGDVTKWQIPKSFQMTERWIYWQDQEQQIEEDTGTVTIDLKNSVISNKAGDDATGAAERIKAYLRTKGYAAG